MASFSLKIVIIIIIIIIISDNINTNTNNNNSPSLTGHFSQHFVAYYLVRLGGAWTLCVINDNRAKIMKQARAYCTTIKTLNENNMVTT